MCAAQLIHNSYTGTLGISRCFTGQKDIMDTYTIEGHGSKLRLAYT